jgi:protocatechuate 3,4-dioxygenase beta subunit
MSDTQKSTRRRFLVAGAAAAGSLQIGFAPDRAWGQAKLAPTPACGDGDEPTPRQTEGPFYTPDSPRRADLREAGMPGRPCELAGLVLTRSCRPVANALVDLWHADDRGDYDNKGFRLRGHVFTDAEGRYAFRTIVPGVYTGRTRHFHVKVQAARRPVLTTQFYFPNEAGNRRDGLYRPELLMRVTEAAHAVSARFDVVLDIA